MITRNAILPVLALLLSTLPVRADPPVVVGVTTGLAGMGWRFEVTISHPDSGWDHFADGWEILDSQGNRLGWRELQHPHVDEQPFTRSLSNVMIPDGTKEVFVRTRCSRDSWSKDLTRVVLKR
jgi:hypothetical protein